MSENNICELPFVSDKDLWSVCETGNWSADNRQGAEHGKRLVSFLRENPARAPMLGNVLRDMVRKGNFGAVEVGFSHYLAAILASNRL